jgi:predicted metal-dependent enzyme (double-stranded beta helix superfamily)
VTSFAVDTFVGECLEAVRTEGSRGSLAVNNVLESALDDPSSIEQAVGASTDIPLFTTWHNSAELTVLHVVWPPTVDLLAHDHEMWATIGLYGGREDNRYFRARADGSLEQRGGTTLLAGDSVVLGHDVIHAVANPSKAWTAAIHIYGGDYFGTPRRMWPDDDEAPIDFDVSRLTATLEAAAARNH